MLLAQRAALIAREHGLEPAQGLWAEPGAPSQQEPAVGPGRVDLHPAASLLLAQRPLSHVGDHLVAQHHEVEVVQHDPRVAAAPA